MLNVQTALAILASVLVDNPCGCDEEQVSAVSAGFELMVV